MDDTYWDNEIWTVIDSYFKNTNNYLSRNQIESYNTFLDTNISKTIRQFNPIVLPYARDPKTHNYKFELRVTIGGSRDSETGEIKNDGKGIYIGKPIIQEIQRIEGEDGQIDYSLLQKVLYPNEARLKNITYKTEILVDVFAELLAYEYDQANPKKIVDTQKVIKEFSKIPLGNLPIMTQSKICSLDGAKGETLRLMGECEYDQGGYFLFDGKEKAIVAQERDVENKIYISYIDDPNQRYKYESKIRSSPENKFQPARITKVVAMYKKKNRAEEIEDNAIRVIIPNLDGEIPLFWVMRALGITSDYDICKAIIPDMDSELGKAMLDTLRPSIVEGSIVTNQSAAIEILLGRMTKNWIDTDVSREVREAFLIETIKNWFLPHVGTNYLDKVYFLGYMVNQVLLTILGIKKQTDRDSYIFKRIDQSGFLMSSIFRDLYFRVKKRLIEVLNVGYSKKEESDMTNKYWENSIVDNNTVFYNFFNLISGEKQKDSLSVGINIHDIIDRSIMDDGWQYAFKNCWGLKDARGCKEGVVQDLARLSYVGFVSHLRRVNTPLSASAKVRAPHQLHPSTWGIMCPPETPDGANIGVRKNLSIMTVISSGTNSNVLLRALFNSGMESITQLDLDKLNYTRIFLNERFVGYSRTPEFTYRKLKLLKRNALINIYTSIAWYIEENIIRVTTDSGRALRPLLVVDKNNSLAITSSHVEQIKKGEITWHNLVCGFREGVKFNDTDSNYYYIEEESDLELLEKTAGVIEYTDKEEENTLMIALTPKDLSLYKYTHCEIHPSLMLGVLAITTPLLEMNQAPRNQFSAGQGKQALGIYATNFKNRMDNKGQIMFYPQRSIVKSKMEKYIFTDDLPNGMNAIVAIGCFTGYNQDDSIVFNKSSLERGLFRTTKFRTYSAKDDIENNKYKEKIMVPDPDLVLNRKDGNYSKLDENGIVKVGSKVNENDIIVGKCVFTGEKDELGRELLEDNSDYVRRAEDGYVDRVFSSTGNDNQRYVKIRVRKDKIPELGDKFCSRMGQKGTVGMLIPKENLPVSKLGIVPDIMVNAQAFPSRMTIAQFMETLLGKSMVELGMMTEVASFSDNNVEKLGGLLERVGFEKYGNEVMYCGLTGEQMKVNYFIGPTYYLRLTHQVSDKYQSRDQGLRTALTHQPVGGRSQGGGGRVGEMERDALLSHGASSFLKESFMERSDKYKFTISDKTGMISVYNKDKNVYRDFNSDESKQYINSDGVVMKRQTDNSIHSFSTVEAPESFKLLLQEIETMGIGARMIPEKTKYKWNIDRNMLQNLSNIYSEDLDYYSFKNKSKHVAAYYRYISRVKEFLLYIGTADNKFKSLVDLSVGNARDATIWTKHKYTRVLGLEEDINLIEGPHTESTAKQFIEQLKHNPNKQVANWANTTKVDFIVADTTKDILSLDATKLHNNSYTDMLADTFSKLGSTFNNLSCFVGVDKYFENKTNITNFFNNAKKLVKHNGCMLLIELDGQLVFDKLKSKKHISGKIFNHSTKQLETIYEISTTPALDLKENGLSSTTDDLGKNKVVVKYIDQDATKKVNLVHPSLLLSLAKENGFELMSIDNLAMKTNIFKLSTGSLDGLISHYLSLYPEDDLVSQLNVDNNPIREYLSYFRYYILKHNSSDLIPYHEYPLFGVDSKKSQEACYSDKGIGFEEKYGGYKQILKMYVSLDATQLHKHLTVFRDEVGQTINNRKVKNALTTEGLLDIDTSRLIDNVNYVLSNPSFSNISNKHFKNTIKYVFEYIKLGIYVKIVNGNLMVFAPMFNIDYNVNNLTNSPDVDNVSLDEVSWVSSLKMIINNREVSMMEFINTQFNQQSAAMISDLNHVFLDGCRVYFGNNVVDLFQYQFVYTKHMLELLCKTHKDNLLDAEFIINPLRHPIYSLDEDGYTYNPFSEVAEQARNVLKLDQYYIPVLSFCGGDNFYDIPIPTAFNWFETIQRLLPGNCNSVPVLTNREEDYSKRVLKTIRIGFYMNTEGCGQHSQRSELNDYGNFEKINSLLAKDSNNNYHFDLAVDFTKSVLAQEINKSSQLNRDSIVYIENSLNINRNRTISNRGYPESVFYLYVDGFSTDEYLLHSIYYCSILIRLKPKYARYQWFELLMVPYDFSKSVKENSQANYIEIENLFEDFATTMVDKLVKHKDFMAIKKLLETNLDRLRNKITNNRFIVDYLQYAVNKIGENMSNTPELGEPVEQVILEDIISQSIELQPEFIGLLIGKDGEKLTKLKNINNVDITISNVITDDTGYNYQVISINGPRSGVNAATETIYKVKDNDMKILKIPAKKFGSFLGKKMANKLALEDKYNISIFTNVRDIDIANNLRELQISPIDIKDYRFIKVYGHHMNISDFLNDFNNILNAKRSRDQPQRQQPMFQPQQPTQMRRDSSYDYQPSTPRRNVPYSSTSPVYQPTSPGYQPSTPPYSSTSPVGPPPDSPVYNPTSPIGPPDSPVYNPTSPVGPPDSPVYQPTSPDYRPTSPDYRPTSPDYRPTSPDYRPTSPDYRSTSPDYRPTSPAYSYSSPIRSNNEPSFSITSPLYYSEDAIIKKQDTLDRFFITKNNSKLEVRQNTFSNAELGMENEEIIKALELDKNTTLVIANPNVGNMVIDILESGKYNGTILVCEENSYNVESLNRNLKALGYSNRVQIVENHILRELYSSETELYKFASRVTNRLVFYIRLFGQELDNFNSNYYDRLVETFPKATMFILLATSEYLNNSQIKQYSIDGYKTDLSYRGDKALLKFSVNKESTELTTIVEEEIEEVKQRKQMIVVVSLYNKLAIAKNKFYSDANTFINELDTVLANYQKENVSQVDYKIVIINDIWQSGSIPKYMLDKFYLTKDQYLNPREFNNDSDSTPAVVYNKGANYNLIVSELDKKGEQVDWYVFQELFLLPNKETIPYYFLEPKQGEVLKISHFYEPFLDNNRLGIFSIPKDDYISRYNGFASYMFSNDRVDKHFIERVTRKGGIVKNISKTDKMNFTTKYPQYHVMETAINPDGAIVVDKKQELGMKETLPSDYEHKNIGKHKFYSFGINFTTLPLSTIKTVITENKSDLENNLADYIAFIYQVNAKLYGDNTIHIDMSSIGSENEKDLVLFIKLTEQIRILNIELSNKRLDYEISIVEADNGNINVYVDNVDNE